MNESKWIRVGSTFQEDQAKKYNQKLDEYGHKWTTDSFGHLRKRVKQEFKEWEEKTKVNIDSREEYSELVDLANTVTFLSLRLLSNFKE